jgi:GMP synthase (glutamine-hydrolysing)
MKLHWLQHVPFEGLGYIHEWARLHDAEVTCTRLFANESLPDPGDADLIVIMGGPMGVHDREAFPWLVAEKAYIRNAIDSGRRVVGICLGAQLIADVLGARVYAGPQKEIGWFPVRRTGEAHGLLPEELTVFHWHGDTFTLPGGAVLIASSEACENQGFLWNGRVAALQFHMETTAVSMEALIKNCGHELVEAPFIQSAGEMRNGTLHINAIHDAMTKLLDRLMGIGGSTISDY